MSITLEVWTLKTDCHVRFPPSGNPAARVSSLVQAGSERLPSGIMSEKLGIRHNTMSFYLNHLSNTEIVTSRR